MTDIAELGLRADSSDIRTATTDLARLERGAGTAERASERFERQAQRMSRTMREMRGVVRDLAVGFAGGLGISGIVATMSNAVGAARQFKAAYAEVRTLLDDTSGLDASIAKLKEQSLLYGRSSTELVKAYYQAISAGAAEGAQAVGILDAANRLATGGVTNITTAVDGLTNATNAFAQQGLTAESASDALFVAMRAGKTTIDQLSNSLNIAGPIAASLGVSFDDMLAAVSAITTTGTTTATAFTQVRAALAAVIKPSSEAAKLAKSLGLEFNVAALQSQGFAGFLEQVAEKTGGSEEAIATLFSSIEAVGGVMALSGPVAEKYAQILEQMGEKAGQTDKAFQAIMENDPGQQLTRATTAVAEKLKELGVVILTTLAPAAKFLADNIEEVSAAVAFAAKGVGVLAVVFTARLLVALGASAAAMVRVQTQALGTQIALARLGTAGGTAAAGVAVLTGALTTLGRLLLRAFGGWVGVVIVALAGLATQFNKTQAAAAGMGTGATRSLRELADEAQRLQKGGIAFTPEQLAALDVAQREIVMLTNSVRKLEEQATAAFARGDNAGGLNFARAATAAKDRIAELVKDMNRLQSSTAVVAEEIEEAAGFAGGLSEETAKTAKDAEKVADEFERAADALEREERNVRLQLEQQNRINELLREGASTDDARNQAAREYEEIRSNTLDTDRKALEVAKQQTAQIEGYRAAEAAQRDEMRRETARSEEERIEIYRRAGGRIEEIFVGVFRGALDGFGSFKDALKDQFKNLLAEMALQAARNKIIIPIVASVAGALGMGSEGIGGLISGLGGNLSSLGNLGSLFGGDMASAFFDGAVLPFADVLGSMGFEGLAVSVTNLGSTLAPLVGALPSLLAAGGALFGAGSLLARDDSNIRPEQQGIGALVGGPYALAMSGIDRVTGGNLFGTKYRTIAETLTIEIQDGIADAMLETLQKGKKSGFGGSKYRTFIDELALQDLAINDAFGEVAESVSRAMSRLRGDLQELSVGDLFDGLSFSGDILGVENGFAMAIDSITDDMALRLLPVIGQFRTEGETLAQTLVRVVNETATLQFQLGGINDAFASMGGDTLVFLSQNLAEAAGGADRLGQLTSQFLQDFYTEAERAAITTQFLTSEFAALGLELPESVEAYRELVASINPVDEAAQALIVSVLELAPAFRMAANGINGVADTLESGVAAGVRFGGGGPSGAYTGNEPGFFGNESAFDDVERAAFVEGNRQQFLDTYGAIYNEAAALRMLENDTVEQIQRNLSFAIGEMENRAAAAAPRAGDRSPSEEWARQARGRQSFGGVVESGWDRMARENEEAAKESARAASEAAAERRRLAEERDRFRTQAQNAFLPLEELAALRLDEFERAVRSLGFDTIPTTGEEFLALGERIFPLTSQFQELLRLQEQLADTGIASAEKQRDIARQLRDYIAGLDISERAGDPVQRLDEALRQFREARALAFSGDMEAAAKLTSLADAVLPLADEVFASGQGRDEVFSEVRDSLASVAAGLEISSETEEDVGERTIAHLAEQVELLQALLAVSQEGFTGQITAAAYVAKLQEEQGRNIRLTSTAGGDNGG